VAIGGRPYRVEAALAKIISLVGELFRIAFERRKTFDASRASALPWRYGIGSNLVTVCRWVRPVAGPPGHDR
jgi:hypothetical protein